MYTYSALSSSALITTVCENFWLWRFKLLIFAKLDISLASSIAFDDKSNFFRLIELISPRLLSFVNRFPDKSNSLTDENAPNPVKSSNSPFDKSNTLILLISSTVILHFESSYENPYPSFNKADLIALYKLGLNVLVVSAFEIENGAK